MKSVKYYIEILDTALIPSLTSIYGTTLWKLLNSTMRRLSDNEVALLGVSRLVPGLEAHRASLGHFEMAYQGA